MELLAAPFQALWPLLASEPASSVTVRRLKEEPSIVFHILGGGTLILPDSGSVLGVQNNPNISKIYFIWGLYSGMRFLILVGGEGWVLNFEGLNEKV